MRSRISAGLVMFRVREQGLQVLLAHPGGPLFARKDAGHWTIPKGEVEADADVFETARREFEEETGVHPPAGAVYHSLGSIRQKGGKMVHAWGFAGDVPAGFVAMSNSFSMEWPPGSGQMRVFPEVDRAEFFSLAEARVRIKPAQVPLLDELERQVGGASR